MHALNGHLRLDRCGSVENVARNAKERLLEQCKKEGCKGIPLVRMHAFSESQ